MFLTKCFILRVLLPYDTREDFEDGYTKYMAFIKVMYNNISQWIFTAAGYKNTTRSAVMAHSNISYSIRVKI